jgi:hypothetical protein
MGAANPGIIFYRSNLEMVKYITFIICILLCFTSCHLFFQTPFPEELIYWEDSVPIEEIGFYEYGELYYVEPYVFLFIQQQNDMNKLYIFTEDLEQLPVQDISYHCDTFAMKDVSLTYYIGSGRYEIDDPNVTTHENQDPLSNPDLSLGNQPPYGFGFSHNNFNYYIWWDDGAKALQYYQFNSNWGLETQYSVELSLYDDIRALYYNEDPEDPNLSKVIIFFSKGDEDKYNRDIDVAMIPAYHFEGDLSTIYYFTAYMAEDTVTLGSIDDRQCYFTGDGFVIRDHSGTSVRYDMEGNVKETLSSSESEDITETYSQDGKTRYIFSEKYMRLMKASVWW